MRRAGNANRTARWLYHPDTERGRSRPVAGLATMRYSIFSLMQQALTGHRGWGPAWRDAVPRPSYDVLVIGGGGHGLATAYYLARQYSVRNVAVLEKGWLGGGNTGRNTTNVRSDYMFPESAAIYNLALNLYEGLAQEINFNIMLSQRGWLTLIHNQH